MAPSPIDPVAIGKLIERVEALTRKLDEADTQMENLSKRLGEIERYSVWGKGAIFGALLFAGAAAWGLKDMVNRFLGISQP